MIRQMILLFALTQWLAAQDPAPVPQPTTAQATTTLPNAGADARLEKVTYTTAILLGKDGETNLSTIAGAFSTTYAVFTALIYSDFPDEAAQVRTKDRQPTVYFYSNLDPRGRIFLVKAKVNRGKKTRSVKLGRSHFAGIGGMMTPDPDWTIPYDFKKTAKENVWQITPKAPMVPGEYGLFSGPGSGWGGASIGGSMFDFTVE